MVRSVLRGGRAAVTFLTRLPLGGFPFADDELRWSSGWFPSVGLVIGTALAAVWSGLSFLNPAAAAVLTFTTGLLLTGAFHEDGLADTADALGGGYDRESVFRILKDSRVGAYGAVALVASFSARVTLLAGLGAYGGLALVISQCVSRLPPVWLMALLPYVTPEGQARSLPLARAGPAQVALATGTVFVLLGVLCARGLVPPGCAVALAGGAGLLGGSAGAYFRQRMQGVTGDFLGATQQVIEVGTLVIMSACWSVR